MDIRLSLLVFSASAVLGHWLAWAQPLWPYWLAAGALLAPVRSLRLLAAGALGLAWSTWHIGTAQQHVIDAACGETELVGRIADLPARTTVAAHATQVLRFDFVIERSPAPSCVSEGKVRLVWIDGPELRGGETWSLRLRLRPPTAAANSHGFDAGRWHLRNGIVATGYVTSGTAVPATEATPMAVLDRFRERVRDRLRDLNLVNTGVLSALTLGDAAAIPREDMELYRRTTTMHLLVISGLHVGVVTAFGFLLGRGVAFLLAVPVKPLAVAGGLLCGAGYVLLAGAGLSLVRAFTMSAVGMMALVTGRSVSALGAFAYALAAVLLVDPFAPLAPGFWLSFGAVAVLLGFFAPRIFANRGGGGAAGASGWLSSAFAAQLAMALVFAPAVIGITGLLHPLGILVNLAAVPLVTLLTVPLALTGTMFSVVFVGEWLLRGADFCITWCGEILRAADRIAPFYIGGDAAWLMVASTSAAACLLPISRLAKAGLASVVVLILAWPALRPPDLPTGQVEIEALDVGQGTAVLVRTRNHVLLYDAGPAFRTGSDAGTSVVLPVLRGRGIGTLDALILSHSDLDHIGGAHTVLTRIGAKTVLAGEVVPGVESRPCEAGSQWQWDGVRFAFVWPPKEHAIEGNSASCVLLIETPTRRALLAGDIEGPVEPKLSLPVLDLLLVPHHGSATSSSAAFVAMTRPTVAIVAAGWDNHFGHPHPTVVERYRAVGSHVVSTAVSGAVRWRSSRPDSVETLRCRQSPYWRGQPDGPWRRPSALSRRLADC